MIKDFIIKRGRYLCLTLNKEEGRQDIRSVGQILTVLGVGHCELRSGGHLDGEGPLPGLNGHGLPAGPPGMVVGMSVNRGTRQRGRL